MIKNPSTNEIFQLYKTVPMSFKSFLSYEHEYNLWFIKCANMNHFSQCFLFNYILINYLIVYLACGIRDLMIIHVANTIYSSFHVLVSVNKHEIVAKKIMKFDVQKYFDISTIHGFCYISRQYHIVGR